MPPDAGHFEKDDLTIEKILEEKKVFDLSLSFEKVDTAGSDREWKHPGMFDPPIAVSSFHLMLF